MVTRDRRESADRALEAELQDRVTRLLAARGVPRARVSAAVRQVVAALPALPALPADRAAAPDAPSLLATFAAPRADLGSALRSAAAGAGVAFVQSGRGTAGRHTVIAAVVRRADGDKLPALAAAVGAALSVGEAPAA